MPHPRSIIIGGSDHPLDHKAARARMVRRCILLMLMSLLSLVTAGCSPEAGRYQFTVMTEGQHRIMTGETIDAALVILGGRVVVEERAIVTGPLVLLSGDVVVAGVVAGDVYFLNGALTLGPTARLAGDLTLGGGLLQRAPGAVIAGQVHTAAAVPAPPHPAEWTARALLTATLLALLAALIARLAPRPLRRVARTAGEQPVVAVALGLLGVIVLPALLTLMVFTILLIPVAAAGAALLGALAVYGWVAVGLVLGQRLTRRFPRLGSPVVAAALGTTILTLVVYLLSLAPVIGLMATAVAIAVGLGAIFLTGGGARPFVPANQVDQIAAASHSVAR
jgi:hypothetical protein